MEMDSIIMQESCINIYVMSKSYPYLGIIEMDVYTVNEVTCNLVKFNQRPGNSTSIDVKSRRQGPNNYCRTLLMSKYQSY